MKHTCCCGASIEVSSMYVITEKIEWEKFNQIHAECLARRRKNLAAAHEDDGFESWFATTGVALLASSLKAEVSWHRMARAAWGAAQEANK